MARVGFAAKRGGPYRAMCSLTSVAERLAIDVKYSASLHIYLRRL